MNKEEKKSIYNKKYREKNREKLLKKEKEFRKKNKKSIQKYLKKYRKNHRNEAKEYSKEYYKNNNEEIIKKNSEYRQKNKHKRNATEKIKRDGNICYKIEINLRSRLYHAIKNDQKVGSAISDLGCSVDKLKQYLEKQFYPHPKTRKQMTWKNYGLFGWHIDHIKPLASFDLTDRKQFLNACHYYR